MNAFDGKFLFIIKDEKPTTLSQDKEYITQIEENLLKSMVYPFQYPHVKVETKTRASSSSDLDLISLLTQNIDHMSNKFFQSHNKIMGRLNTMERNQFPPKPHFTRQQRDANSWKPRPQQEEKTPDTLKIVGMVET